MSVYYITNAVFLLHENADQKNIYMKQDKVVYRKQESGIL